MCRGEQLFRFLQSPAPVRKPAFAPITRIDMRTPFPCRDTNRIERTQRIALLVNPRPKRGPLAQDRFMRDLDGVDCDTVNCAAVAHQQPLVDQMSHESMCSPRQSVDTLNPSCRFTLGVIDLNQTWNESRPCQLLKPGAISRQRRIALCFGEGFLDCGQNRALQSSQLGSVVSQSQRLLAAMPVKQSLKGEGQERQGVIRSKVLEQLFRQQGFDGERRLCMPRRPFDHLLEGAMGNRTQTEWKQ